MPDQIFTLSWRAHESYGQGPGAPDAKFPRLGKRKLKATKLRAAIDEAVAFAKSYADKKREESYGGTDCNTYFKRLEINGQNWIGFLKSRYKNLVH